MIDYILIFIAGLLVGWNILPQPAWVKAIYDKIKEKIIKLMK